MIKLIEVDLTDLTEDNLPKIELGEPYLALVRTGYGYPEIVKGEFSPVWFGYNFHIGSHSMQWSNSGRDAERYYKLWKIDVDVTPYYIPEPVEEECDE